MGDAYNRVYQIVCRIPPGKVLTYGLISALLDGRLSAQGVGWALRALPPRPVHDKAEYTAANVPWHRVINSQGRTSTHKNGDIPPHLQRHLLEREGVVFGDDDAVDLSRFLWQEGLSEN